jgi:hypothetical protein
MFSKKNWCCYHRRTQRFCLKKKNIAIIESSRVERIETQRTNHSRLNNYTGYVSLNALGLPQGMEDYTPAFGLNTILQLSCVIQSCVIIVIASNISLMQCYVHVMTTIHGNRSNRNSILPMHLPLVIMWKMIRDIVNINSQKDTDDIDDT